MNFSHGQLLENILSLLSVSLKYDFASGDYNFNPFLHVADEDLNESERAASLSSRVGDNFPTAHDAILEYVGSTNLHNISSDQLRIHPTSTRGAIAENLRDIFQGEPSYVALPVPNWFGFWMGKVKTPTEGFFCLDGTNEDRLVQGVEQSINCGAKALILADPSSPLLTRLSKTAATRIAEVSQRHGMEVIIDQVYHASQTNGGTDSLANYIPHARIVNGFSHFLGSDPRVDFSYTILPENSSSALNEEKLFSTDTLVGRQLQLVFRDALPVALSELKSRNEALRKGFDYFPQGTQLLRPTEPSTSSIISLVTLPDGVDALAFARYVPQDLIFAPMPIFYPDQTPVPNQFRSYLRLSVGQLDSYRIDSGMKLLGDCLHDYMGIKRK